MLHVGDHPVNDVVAAERAGMPSVWLNRRGMLWPDEHELPAREVTDLRELSELLDE